MSGSWMSYYFFSDAIASINDQENEEKNTVPKTKHGKPKICRKPVAPLHGPGTLG